MQLHWRWKPLGDWKALADVGGRSVMYVGQEGGGRTELIDCRPTPRIWRASAFNWASYVSPMAYGGRD
jgi:hypothetical protein